MPIEEKSAAVRAVQSVKKVRCVLLCSVVIDMIILCCIRFAVHYLSFESTTKFKLTHCRLVNDNGIYF